MKKLCFVLLSMLSLPLCAQDFRVLQISAPQSVSFAKPFEANIIVSHPQNTTIELNPESVSNEFALTQTQFSPIDDHTTQAVLTIYPFTLQQSTFTASFALAGRPEQTAALTFPITVDAVKVFNDKKLREIRPPQRFFDWFLLLCILLALAAIICLIIWWVRRNKAVTNPALRTPVDNRPPHVIALSQIDALVDSGLWENKQYKVFYITLTDILRTYLQRAFGLDVSADTSVELLRHVKAVPVWAPLTQSLRNFLSSGDLVKFAKVVPTQEQRNRDISLLREMIHQTAPKPPQETPSVEVKL